MKAEITLEISALFNALIVENSGVKVTKTSSRSFKVELIVRCVIRAGLSVPVRRKKGSAGGIAGAMGGRIDL